ncbi:OmpH family outer membrane protein [Lentisphaerota bacterium ZTH]|nr:OmpH family outer membrane protein [Lentisphaerota bacterium]WET06776.1 OmpH family outer membrane protein [Lentisphaerota bacterium ZTH]
MLKKLSIIVMVFTSVALFAAPKLKIATVDMEKIFENFYKKKLADATLKQQDEIYKAFVRKLLDSGNKLEEEYKILRDASQNIALSASEREKKRLEAQRKFRAMQQKKAEIEQYVMEKQRQFKKLEKKKRMEIIGEIMKEIKRRAALKGYTLVLDKTGKTLNAIPAVLYSSPSYDITDEVLKTLNRGQDNPDITKDVDSTIR